MTAEEGEIKCPICGEVSVVDPNDTADMLVWFNKHVFGHVNDGSGNDDR